MDFFNIKIILLALNLSFFIQFNEIIGVHHYILKKVLEKLGIAAIVFTTWEHLIEQIILFWNEYVRVEHHSSEEKVKRIDALHFFALFLCVGAILFYFFIYMPLHIIIYRPLDMSLKQALFSKYVHDQFKLFTTKKITDIVTMQMSYQMKFVYVLLSVWSILELVRELIECVNQNYNRRQDLFKIKYAKDLKKQDSNVNETHVKTLVATTIKLLNRLFACIILLAANLLPFSFLFYLNTYGTSAYVYATLFVIGHVFTLAFLWYKMLAVIDSDNLDYSFLKE